jgi:tight adherence protein B
MSDRSLTLEREFISDVEMFASALTASLSLPQALVLMSTRASVSWRAVFNYISEKVELVGLYAAVGMAKHEIKDHRFDLLLEVIAAETRFGNTNISSTLLNHAARLRRSLAVRVQVHEKIRAVKGVARIAIAAPWLVLLVICSRSESLEAFVSISGLSVLGFGAASCWLAWWIMSRLARLSQPTRTLAA